MGIKVIITGTTGFVGEGVLFECLKHSEINEILIVNRKSYGLKHPKLKECIVPDFLSLEAFTEQLTGYDACFFCAGISSNGLNEKEYTHITYEITMHFASKLVSLNPEMIFIFVSGSLTDSSEKSKMMWARVKGKTENALMKLPFKMEYNFRPGFMKATLGQKNIKSYYKIIGWMYPLLRILFPNHISTMREVGLAMINCTIKGYSKQILEIKDIKLIAKAKLNKNDKE